MSDQEAINNAVDNNIKILNAESEKAKNYTNLIIFGGYAGFFGLWQITKDYLVPKQAVGAALAMLISIFIFVFFEIFKTHQTGRRIGKLHEIISRPENKKSSQVFDSAINQYRTETIEEGLFFHKIWMWTFYPTVGFGLLGVGILAIAFLSKLLSEVNFCFCI